MPNLYRHFKELEQRIEERKAAEVLLGLIDHEVMIIREKLLNV